MAEIEYFTERQSFSPRILGLIVMSTALVGFYAYVGTKDAPGAEIGLLVVAGALAFVVALFNFLGFTTTVAEEGVRVKGMLFVDRLIRYDEIASAERRDYKPIVEYGGWGYRIGPAGKAYNAQGNEGVQLVLKDGGRILIGSQRADALAAAIAARI